MLLVTFLKVFFSFLWACGGKIFGDMMIELRCPKCNGLMKIVYEKNIPKYAVCQNCGYVIKLKKPKREKEEKKLSKGEMIEKLKEFAKKYVNVDLIDFNSIVDSSLSYEENLERIKEEIKKINPNIVFDEFDEEKANVEFKKHYEEQMRLEINEMIKKIKESKNSNLDKYFRPLIELVKVVVKGEEFGLIIYGDGGLGKTYSVLKAMSELNLEYGTEFIYVNSYVTPLELYNLLWEHNGKVIILDDVEKLLKDEKTIGILKACLEANLSNKRIVSYFSTTNKLDAPEQFEFEGKLIIIMNEIKNSKKSVESLISRVLTYELNFNYHERIQIMYELAKELNIPFELVDFVKENVTPANTNLNLRTLKHLYNIYSYYKANGNQEKWKELAKTFLMQGEDKVLKVVWELMNSNMPVKEQVKVFLERTGMSRRTYFRYKAKLKEYMQLPF